MSYDMITPDSFSAKQEEDGKYHVRVFYTTPDGVQRQLHSWGGNSRRKRARLNDNARLALHSLGVASPV